MSVALLDKTRKIGKLLHNNSSSKVVFNDICKVLGQVLESNVLVISKKGKLLGLYNHASEVILDQLLTDKVGEFIDAELNDRFLDILSTRENMNIMTLGFEVENVSRFSAMTAPIDIGGERLGTLFVYRYDRLYDIDDIILTEYGSTVVGLEMMRSIHEEAAEENRRNVIVKSALNTLSYTELEAVNIVFEELNGSEGLLVASKIADISGITRSVIVNAIRKLESAGVIESRSSGMKGTYIKVKNDLLYDELERMKMGK